MYSLEPVGYDRYRRKEASTKAAKHIYESRRANQTNECCPGPPPTPIQPCSVIQKREHHRWRCIRWCSWSLPCAWVLPWSSPIPPPLSHSIGVRCHLIPLVPHPVALSGSLVCCRFQVSTVWLLSWYFSDIWPEYSLPFCGIDSHHKHSSSSSRVPYASGYLFFFFSVHTA